MNKLIVWHAPCTHRTWSGTPIVVIAVTAVVSGKIVYRIQIDPIMLQKPLSVSRDSPERINVLTPLR